MMVMMMTANVESERSKKRKYCKILLKKVFKKNIEDCFVLA